MTTIGGTAPEVAVGRSSLQNRRRGPSPRRLFDSLLGAEESIWRWAARVAVLLPLAALVFAVTVLAIKARPAIVVNGWSFLTTTAWNPGSAYGATVHTHGIAHPQGATYGALMLIVGTLQSSVIALIFAVPVAIGCAFALTERLPRILSRPLGFAVELLAGVPSVIIGLWGVLTLGPWLARDIYPHIASVMPNVPPLSYFRAPTGHGLGLMTTGLVLGLMIVPIIAATTADLFRQVPTLPKEGGEALGMTDSEVANRITLRWVRSGIIGASVLGLGRALGETIAVAMISGDILHVAPNIWSPMSSIAAAILTQLDGALTDGTGFAVATLAELALVLAVISVLVNLLARWIVARTSRLAGPVGAGA